MRLSFCQKVDTSDRYSRLDGYRQSAQQAYREELLEKEPYTSLKEKIAPKLVDSDLPAVENTKAFDESIFSDLHCFQDENGYKVAKLKSWCENELTPLAWQRVLVRTLPALRKFGYELEALQYPNEEVRINKPYLRLICTTLSEMYSSKDFVDFS